MDAQTLRRALTDFIRFNPKDFVVRGSPTGFMVGLAKITASGGATVLPFPWKISIKIPATHGGMATASVYPGTLSQLLPTNIFSAINLGTTDPTTGALTGTYYITVNAVTDGKEPNSCTINASTTAPAAPTLSANTAPTSFVILLGVVDNGVIYQIESENLDYYAQVAFVESQAPTAPGDEPFKRWWKWARNDGNNQAS